MHIAHVGLGRVGRPTVYSILSAGLPDELTVCDIKPGLAQAFGEELRHAAASLRSDTIINYRTDSKEISNADIILISAGVSRLPGEKISRRDLAVKNTKIVGGISESTKTNNPQAKYVMITNPVDSMAMLCKKITNAEFVISTGTSLESARLRSKVAYDLNVPVSSIQGFAGGEHGEAALSLWSTIRIAGDTLMKYAQKTGKSLDKNRVEQYMREVSRGIIDGVGATEIGPAAVFTEIVKAITKNTDQVISVSTPMNFPSISMPVFVGVPIKLGSCLGPSLYNYLLDEEKTGIQDAAKAIYDTFISS